ncbi:hypothetical protein LTR08_001479 [Meristemomyces frigidus]|nr:hypothetical protein LTR08_001479 [Meristemomyces frigidus]
MSSLFARLGQLETRITTQTLRNSDKRNRQQEWVCRKCRWTERVVVGQQQRRGYAADEGPVDQDPFPPWESREEAEHEERVTHVPWGKDRARAPVTRRDSWGGGDGIARPLGANEGFAEETTQIGDEEDEWSHHGDDRPAAHDRSHEYLWEQFERAEDDADNVSSEASLARDSKIDTHTTFAIHSERDRSLLDVDYAALLPGALARRTIDMTVRCFFAASRANDLEYLRSIDEATFSELLRVVEPVNSIDKLASAHLEISNAVAQQLGISSIQKVAWEYSNIIQEVVAIRRSVGIKLTLKDYAVLLRGARDLGNRRLASTFWRELAEDGHVPNIYCYNYYMAVVVFDRLHNAESRHKLRIIPFHMLARKAEYPGTAFKDYRVGAGGVKDKVIAVFSEMLKSGAHANEESFRVIITAAAREGELSTVKSILRKIWGVEVDALIAGKDEATIRPKELDKASPLYPTSKLLFTVAHAFGINNDIPTALRLVDFIARHYSLPIDQEVWSQLFEWTFMLACERTGVEARRRGTKVGQLPRPSVMHLWDTMTGAPYLMEPTIGMYNCLIKNLFFRDKTRTMVEKMLEGRLLHLRSSHNAAQAWTALKDELLLSEQHTDLVSQLEILRDRWEWTDLLRKRNHFWLKRWLRLLLASMRATVNIDYEGDWSFRRIPSLLWELRSYAPRRVRYEVLGGIVEFDFRTQEGIDYNAIQRAGGWQRRKEILDRVPKYVGGDWLRLARSEAATLPKRMNPDGGGIEDGLPDYWQEEMSVVKEKRGEGEEVKVEEEGTRRFREEVRDAIDRR